MGEVISTMEFVNSIFNWLKPKEDKNEGSTVALAENNPVTTQTSSNSSSPQFITNVLLTPVTPGSSTLDLSSTTLPSLSEQGPCSTFVRPSYAVEHSSSATSMQSVSSHIRQSQRNGTIATVDAVKWVLAKADTAEELSDRAVIGGYDYDGSPLWVIRSRLGGELLPGKLNIVSKRAYVASNLDEVTNGVFEVCCAPKNKIKWVEARNGAVPSNAILGGKTLDGEKLYIGRATYDRSLSPGKIQPSHRCCYVTEACKAHPVKNYEVLCSVKWQEVFKIQFQSKKVSK